MTDARLVPSTWPPNYGVRAAPRLTMSVTAMRLARDAACKRSVQYGTLHVLCAHPIPGLGKEGMVRIQQARADLVGPDLSGRLVDGSRRLTLRHGELVDLLPECQSEPDLAMPHRMMHAASTQDQALSRNPTAVRGWPNAIRTGVATRGCGRPDYPVRVQAGRARQGAKGETGIASGGSTVI